MIELSLDEARALMLAAQGLGEASNGPADKGDVLGAIRRMGALQIDMINVVNRSPYFVLWSRLGAYEQSWLDELLEEGALFEYWAHAACFLPIEDFPFYRRRMVERSKRWGGWLGSNEAVQARVMGHIREHGGALSAQFESTEANRGGWWNWKAEKMALEALFDAGELMIAKRRNFQRLYDLRERVLPEWDDSLTPSHEQVRRQLALRAVKVLGVALTGWVADYFRIANRGVATLLAELAADGSLLAARIEGFDEPAFVHPENVDLRERARGLSDARTTLLSPFDPVVWDRKRALQLFGFDYKIECYTPAPKRTYGYFTLPILHRGRLVGRVDPKAHRKDGIFEVKSVHLEPEVEVTEALVSEVAATVRDCAEWHRTPEVVVQESYPAKFGPAMSRVLARGG
jgi:uncharacterized protein YcaQ